MKTPEFEVEVLEADGSVRIIRKIAHMSLFREKSPLVVAAELTSTGVAVDIDTHTTEFYGPNRVLKVRIKR